MTNRAKILVIENEPGASMMMVYSLTRAGCNVQAAWNAKKGIRLAQKKKFDLIVLNAALPGISGFELCRRLKEDPCLYRTPIVFIGHPCDEDQERALELGAADYIAKPFGALDFVRRLLSHVKPTSVMA